MTCRVLIDAPQYRGPTRGGVNRFVAEVAAALRRTEGFEAVVRAPAIHEIEADVVSRRRSFRGRSYLPWLDRAATRACVRRDDVDLYLNAYYAWQPRLPVPSVCVVYDMIYEKLLRRSTRSRQLIARKRQCIGRADHILCDSEATRQDLLSLYPAVAETSVETMHLGVDTSFFSPIEDAAAAEALRARTQGAPYWLFVGRREFAYKNFGALLRGFRQSSSLGSHKIVVIGGSQQVTARERAELGSLHLDESVLFLGHVSDALLRAAYASAEALVYPSLYEGFGLPVLEAMACGSLVLSSNAASLPEVGGDVALYFSPTDTQALAEAMDAVASMSGAERSRRVQAGLQRASEFSWSRCTDQVMTVLSRIVQNWQATRPRDGSA